MITNVAWCSHLYAGSGSGKTRLCLEGLCHRWGLYISCRGASSVRAAGSHDFTVATELMTTMSTWGSCTQNRDAAHRAFAMLICARVFVLKCLLVKLPPDTDMETARRRWVLVQAMPPIDIATDIFAAVLKSLRAAVKTDLLDFTESMLKNMGILEPNVLPFVVVDEAQVAAEYLNESFRATAGIDSRPVLQPFYSFLWDTRLFQGVILAGTGLSMKMVRTAVYSRSAQRQNHSQVPVVFVEVGEFTKDGTDHKTYIEKYLPFSINAFDQRLMERILYWFRGRYAHPGTL